MIPDFLQNPGGLPNPAGRPSGSDSVSPSDSTSAGDGFMRALQSQQSSRSHEPPSRTETPGPDGDVRQDQPSTPKAETPPRSGDQGAGQPATDSQQSDASRQRDSERSAGAGQRVDGRRGDDDAAASGDPQETSSTRRSDADLQRPSDRDDGVADEGGVSSARSPEAAGSDDGLSNSQSIGKSGADRAVILVDAFSTQVEATTVTDVGLELDVESGEGDGTVAEELQGAAVEVLSEPDAEISQPLVLGSLVSIAVAESELLRRQQVGTEQAATEQGGAGDTFVVNQQRRFGEAQSGEAAANGSAVDGAEILPAVENPVLPSLLAAKTGRQLERPTQNAAAPVDVDNGIVDGDAEAVPRSEATPRTLTIDQPASRPTSVRPLNGDQAGTASTEPQIAGTKQGTGGESVNDDTASRPVEQVDSSSGDTSRTEGQRRVDDRATGDGEERLSQTPLTENSERRTSIRASELKSETGSVTTDSQSVATSETADDVDQNAPVSIVNPKADSDGRRRKQTPRSLTNERSVDSVAGDGATPDNWTQSAIGVPNADPAGRSPSATTGAGESSADRAKSDSASPGSQSSQSVTESVGPATAIDTVPTAAASDPALISGEVSTAAQHVRAASAEALSSTVASGNAGEQTGGSAGTGGVSSAANSAAGGAVSSSLPAGDSAASPLGGSPEPAVIGGPDRFLSPNVQRALSAIQSAEIVCEYSSTPSNSARCSSRSNRHRRASSRDWKLATQRHIHSLLIRSPICSSRSVAVSRRSTGLTSC